MARRNAVLMSLMLPWKSVEVDISSGHNDADSFSGDVQLALQQCPKRHRRGWLDDDFHDLPGSSHRRNDRVFADRDDAIEQAREHRKRLFTQPGAQPIGDGFWMVLRLTHARL